MTTAFEDKTMGTVTKRLLPFLMLLYLIAYLDRSNISVAALQMNADLGLSARMYGLGAGLFYVTYILFEIPSNVILTKVGARRWIARIMVTWGLVAIGMAFIKTPGQLYGMRLLLGTAEAGFTPGIIYFLSQWFPSNKRARAMSFFYIAAALASVIGLPLSGALLGLQGVLGFAGWRWLYLIEGVPALLLGVAVLRYLPDSVQSAGWLSAGQKQWLSGRIAGEAKLAAESTLTAEPKPNAKGSKASWYGIFLDKRVWLLSLFWLLQAFGTIGVTLFLPQILKEIAGGTDLLISSLSALPFLFACLFMYFNGRHSDATGERRLHLGIPLLFSGILLIIGLYTGTTITYVLLVFSVALNWAVTPVFWAVTTEYLSAGPVAAGSIALINAMANIAGAALPYLIGSIKDAKGNYDYALWMVGIALMIGGLLGMALVRKKKIVVSGHLKLIFALLFITPALAKAQKKAIEIHRFPIQNATHLQGVAVNKDFFYAISNSAIAKYQKSTGSFVAVWDGGKDSIIRHLNSGVVIGDKLYCANSNFPEDPMTSSIEIFDTRTMKHIGNHSFGIFAGSATWVDRYRGAWWVVFANYNGKHSSGGRDNRWTTLVKFNDDWNELESWVFPKTVLEAFSPNSNSGGNWNKDGQLYLTGHDKKEMYIMKLPDIGYTLQLLQVVPVVNPGQAIAIDRWQKDREIVYAVNRAENAVIVQEIHKR